MTFHLLAIVGLTHILVESEIFKPIRAYADKHAHPKIAYLLHCYQCSGFWVGFLVGLAFDPHQSLLWGGAGSIGSSAAATVLYRLQNNPQ